MQLDTMNYFKGAQCQFRHVRGDRKIICKYWLKGLCKKGDQCEFLHEYDMAKMPECYFYFRFNACHMKECPFLHINPENKIKDCPWYDRGYCRHGPYCRYRHVRRVLCTNYSSGFCPDGPNCKYTHLRSRPKIEKTINCLKINHNNKEVAQEEFHLGKSPIQNNHQEKFIPQNHFLQKMFRKRREDLSCYKYGSEGHYANRRPKGHLAFSSSQTKENENNDPDQ